MKKVLTTLAALTVITTPAFAQSFCTCDGTGNVLKFTNNPITYQNQAPAIAAILRVGCTLSPWLQSAPTRYSTQMIQQLPAVAASVTMRCSAITTDAKMKAGLGLPSFPS